MGQLLLGAPDLDVVHEPPLELVREAIAWAEAQPEPQFRPCKLTDVVFDLGPLVQRLCFQGNRERDGLGSLAIAVDPTTTEGLVVVTTVKIDVRGEDEPACVTALGGIVGLLRICSEKGLILHLDRGVVSRINWEQIRGVSSRHICASIPTFRQSAVVARGIAVEIEAALPTRGFHASRDIINIPDNSGLGLPIVELPLAVVSTRKVDRLDDLFAPLDGSKDTPTRLRVAGVRGAITLVVTDRGRVALAGAVLALAIRTRVAIIARCRVRDLGATTCFVAEIGRARVAIVADHDLADADLVLAGVAFGADVVVRARCRIRRSDTAFGKIARIVRARVAVITGLVRYARRQRNIRIFSGISRVASIGFRSNIYPLVLRISVRRRKFSINLVGGFGSVAYVFTIHRTCVGVRFSGGRRVRQDRRIGILVRVDVAIIGVQGVFGVNRVLLGRQFAVAIGRDFVHLDVRCISRVLLGRQFPTTIDFDGVCTAVRIFVRLLQVGRSIDVVRGAGVSSDVRPVVGTGITSTVVSTNEGITPPAIAAVGGRTDLFRDLRFSQLTRTGSQDQGQEQKRERVGIAHGQGPPG